MATPIAHKGVVAGAKVQAMTMLDLMRARAGEGGLGVLQQRADERREVRPVIKPTRRRRFISTRRFSRSIASRCGSTITTRPSSRPISTSLGIKYPTVRDRGDAATGEVDETCKRIGDGDAGVVLRDGAVACAARRTTRGSRARRKRRSAASTRWPSSRRRWSTPSSASASSACRKSRRRAT